MQRTAQQSSEECIYKIADTWKTLIIVAYGEPKMTNETGKWWFERHETKNEIFVCWLEDSAPRFGPIDLLAPSENVSHKVKVKLIE